MSSTANKRADATRNRESILDAAQAVLSERPQAGLAEVAAASGLTRTTVYAHFANREELLGALVRRAVTTTVEALDAGGPADGPPVEALRRVLATSWKQISSFGRLMATDAPARTAADHAPIVERVEVLVRRGRADGSFRTDVPEGWLVTTYFALVHAAGQQSAIGALPADQAESALTATVLGAFGVR